MKIIRLTAAVFALAIAMSCAGILSGRGACVSFAGTQLELRGGSVDMSGVAADELPAAIEQLKNLGEIKRIKLTPDSGENLLTIDDVRLIYEAMPDAALDYSFELFGQLVNLADTGDLEYKNVKIGNEGAELFKKVLPMMKSCKRLVIDQCKIDDEVMADLRESVDNVKVVWHLLLGAHGCMTDTRRLRGDPELFKTKTFEKLKYCTEVEFIDFGHNRGLVDVSFVTYMPNLKGIIIADSRVESLEPFRSCKNLQFLEMPNNHCVTDLSPLLDCPNLRLLNISNCRSIHDVSCMMGKESLERFYLPLNYVRDKEQLEALVESLPDCWVTVSPNGDCGGMTENYGLGWRLDAPHNSDKAEWYVELREIFRYKINFYNYDWNLGKEPEMPELHYFK